jgi:hypothetical protein
VGPGAVEGASTAALGNPGPPQDAWGAPVGGWLVEVCQEGVLAMWNCCMMGHTRYPGTAASGAPRRQQGGLGVLQLSAPFYHARHVTQARFEVLRVCR